MAKYIELESALQSACKGCNIEFDDQPCEPCDCYIRKKLLAVPAIDAVPVVRCWECKKHSEANGKHYCKFWRMYCPDDSDFFCKAGEREEGAENG